MTSTTKTILDQFQVRKSKKQKTAFIEWLEPVVRANGYEMKIEKGNGARNIVIGDVESASVVFSAHYDTCAVMPFPNFITPKCIPAYILYQLLITAGMFVFVFSCTFLASWAAGEAAMWAYYLSLFGILGLLVAGPANKHTVNDNTSGVTAVLDLIQAMPEELKGKAAFVLFDLEEAGLLGSAAFASKHRKVMKDKLLVNMDCVSDGETMLFCLRKKAKQDEALFRASFPSDSRVETEFVTKGYIYPSDQANFPRGVGVAALLKTKGGMLYMDKIHTPKDTVYREENVAYLVEGCIRLTQNV